MREYTSKIMYTTPINNKFKPNDSQIGFTLIELMVTTAIIAILASIAIPSYREQIRLNGEQQARQRMLSIANDLSNWRSKTLTYKGFIPKNDCSTPNVERCYSGSDGLIFIPLGSDLNSYNYQLFIVDGSAGFNQLDDSSAVGNSWRMLAVPNTDDGIFKTADAFYMDSLGRRIIYDHTVSNLDIESTHSANDTGASAW